ncbi:MAG: (d)CMP kinase [Clostridia bacterium]|nr:(d)CMP kinase [Clostridia bacterium]
MSIAVAIDGPAGAGKSTIARAAAKELGFIYVDTGALYRSIGLNAIRKGVDLTDAKAIEASLAGLKVELSFDAQGAQIVLLNDEDVSSFIRTPEVSMSASKVSAVPAVRAFLLDLQRNMAKTQSVIMDGRDIGTVVLPNAEVKIFLTASPEIRAKRRFDELIEKGEDVKYEDVLADVIQRDYNDSHREIAPLKPAEDSKLADTSGLTLEESIQLIINIIKENTK